MASVILLILVTVGAYLVVLAGSAAYELTGLDRQTARFQALSAFTGTGFTTRVSRLVVEHPVRRRITSTLIILGYAGTATVLASLVSSVDQASFLGSARNIAVLLVVALALWVILQRLGTQVVSDLMRRILAPRLTGERVPHEELLLYRHGYGLTRVELPPDSRVIGRCLRDLGLRSEGLQVLAVEDSDAVQPVPDPDTTFAPGQHLIVYGDLGNVQRAFGPDLTRRPEAPRSEGTGGVVGSGDLR